MVTLIKLIVEIVESILGGIIEAFFGGLQALIWKDRKKVFDADFLPENEVLSASFSGFCLNGKKALSIENSTKNVLVIGSTGNFKSSGILIPSILRMRGQSSMVVNDPSGELLHKTSGALIEAGYTIQVLNYGNPSSSEGYNPMLRAKSVSDLQKISKMLITTALGAGGKDPFWNMAAENLISLFMRYLVAYTPEEYHTLAQVYSLLSSFAFEPEKIDFLMAEVSDATLFSEYKTFLTYGDKMMSSIIATCRTAFSLFGTDPSVALTTSHDTIDVASFRAHKTCLFINTNIKDMRYYSLITSLFLEQFFGEIMGQLPTNDMLPVFFLLDEASSLSFNALQITVANIRKYNAGILQVYQSAAQITELYGQSVARALTENSFARIYMPGQPIHVAQELEATLGRFEYVDDKGAKQVRPLMTASEIREATESIILCGNNRAIKTTVVPYFKQSTLLLLTELQPYHSTTRTPFDSPPSILAWYEKTKK